MFRTLDDPKSIEEALESIGANFDVELQRTYIRDEAKVNKIGLLREKDMKLVPRYAAIVRTDTGEVLGEPLAVMSDIYGIVQYRDALAFLNNMIGSNLAKMVFARCTDGGRRLHIILKTNEFIALGGGDKVSCFFSVSTSHDGTGQLQAMCTPLHEATQTLFTPMGKGLIKMKHSSRVGDNMAKAAQTTARIHDEFANYGDAFVKCVAMKIDDDQAKTYFRMMVDKNTNHAERRREKLFDIYKHTGPHRNVGSCRGTLFGAMVSAWYWAEMYKTVRVKGGRNKDEVDRKLEARISGDAARAKALAYELGLKILKMGANAWT
jgi:hypothetical protein